MSPLSQSTTGTSCRRQPAHFTVLVCWVADPVNAGVVADGVVLDIHKDNFEIFPGTVAVYPVAVQYAQVSAYSSNTFFCDTTQVTAGFQLVDTVVLWFTVNNTFVVLAFASTAAYSNTVYNEALLSFVTQSAGLVWTRWLGYALDLFALAVFPSTKTKQVAKDITLLFLPDFFQIFVCSHC